MNKLASLKKTFLDECRESFKKIPDLSPEELLRYFLESTPFQMIEYGTNSLLEGLEESSCELII